MRTAGFLNGHDVEKQIELHSNGNNATTEDKNEPNQIAHISKKRTAEVMHSVTEEEMEEYRRKRIAAADPMAGLLGKEELLDNPVST